MKSENSALPVMRHTALISLLLAAAVLSGCDLFGESSEKVAAAKEAEGKAVGGACRHAGRAIEDCYSLNRKADKAAVFAGWRDMNDYMRENKIEAVAPQLAPQPATQVAKVAAEADEAKPDAVADKPAAKVAPAPKTRKAHDS